MIRTTSELESYRTSFTSATHEAHADAPIDKGGRGAGFDPHELLEAALATCLSIVVRKQATQLGYALDSVQTTVRIDRSDAKVSLFQYVIELQGALDEAQRHTLIDAAVSCPVSKTLSKNIVFTCDAERSASTS